MVVHVTMCVNSSHRINFVLRSPKKSRSSTSESQEPEQPQSPDDGHRQDTSPPSDSQLPVTTFIGVTSVPTGILDSVIGTGINPHTRAVGEILVQTAGTSNLEELRPPESAEESAESNETCIESLGFKSMLEKMDLCKVIEEGSLRLISIRKTKMYGVTRDKWRSRVFPPFLSSLYSPGRPRFSLVIVTVSNGRLKIIKLENSDFVCYSTGRTPLVEMERCQEDGDEWRW